MQWRQGEQEDEDQSVSGGSAYASLVATEMEDVGSARRHSEQKLR